MESGGWLMAQWRQQPVLPLVPPKLLAFDPREWPSWQAWSDARFAWLLYHPDRDIDGVDVISAIFEEPEWWQ
jgi:hypothetical protein